MSGFSTSTLYVWERVQNWRKQREWKSMWEQEIERHDKLDKFLYSAMPKSKHASVAFRHSIQLKKYVYIFIYLIWVMVMHIRKNSD